MTAPALSALISRKANLGQGLTLSASQSFDALARTVGPLVAGTVFDRYGPGAPYHLAAATMGIALLVTLVKRKEMDLPGGEGEPDNEADDTAAEIEDAEIAEAAR